MSEDKNVKKKGFLKGMKSELKKVIWPTGEQTVKSTFATIAFVIMVSVVLIVFNLCFNALSNLWIKGLSHEDIINNVLASGDKANSGEDGSISEEIIPDANNEGEDISEDIEENASEPSSEEVAEPVAETSGE